MSQHLFYVHDQSQEFWSQVFKRAQDIKSGVYKAPLSLQDKKVGLLFFEPSSRTRWSFQKACMDLKLPYMTSVVDSSSSKSKGELDQDSLELYIGLGFDLIIMRSKEDDALKRVLEDHPDCKFINAGFGCEAHPTQAFLDFFTWETFCPSLERKRNLLILGDLKHSRVARSHLRMSQIFNYNVGLCAEKGFEIQNPENAQVFQSRSEALDWADLVMPLRTQKERHDQEIKFEPKPLRGEELRKSHFILHPGPFMRGEDLEEDLIKDARSLIFKQKENGVFCRAALLSCMLEQTEG